MQSYDLYLTLWATFGKPAERVVAYRCDGLRIRTNFLVNYIVYLPPEKKPSERQRRWQSATLREERGSLRRRIGKEGGRRRKPEKLLTNKIESR